MLILVKLCFGALANAYQIYVFVDKVKRFVPKTYVKHMNTIMYVFDPIY